MSRYSEWTPLRKENEFRFEDRKTIEKLLNTQKLTDSQKEAIRRLLASYDYARD